ncbi:MAG: GntR family transcriptional regulator [Bacteroidales bacterium]|nr:MAG: GntR family transcriptional regulator [Bacteroidales bacterium]
MSKKLIKVDDKLSKSKYKQIIDSIIVSINEGKLCKGDLMPSINQVCADWGLSRDTVISAYNELKARGIITSSPGKGYYVDSITTMFKHKIFVLFDELNAFKEDLYSSFLEALDGKAQVDIYFHHFNRKIFDSLIKDNNGNYTTYILMPTKFEGVQSTLQSLTGKVIILDQLPSELGNSYSSVFQNFEKDVYNALKSRLDLLEKYKKIVMVYPGGKEPEGEFKGFQKFCKDYKINHQVIDNLNEVKISKGEAYIAIWDRDLVLLVNQAKELGLQLGQDLGIISYNDTSLKQVVVNGITTISTDFKLMGKTLAELVFDKRVILIENPSSLVVRGSL